MPQLYHNCLKKSIPHWKVSQVLQILQFLNPGERAAIQSETVHSDQHSFINFCTKKTYLLEKLPTSYLNIYISRFIVIKCICGFAPMRTGRPEVPTPLLTRKSTPFS